MTGSQRVQLLLSAYSLVAFAILWTGAAAALAGAWEPAEAWVGITGLAPAIQVLLLVAATPIMVALWAVSAALPPAALVAVAAGLGIWMLASAVSFRSALRVLRRR